MGETIKSQCDRPIGEMIENNCDRLIGEMIENKRDRLIVKMIESQHDRPIVDRIENKCDRPIVEMIEVSVIAIWIWEQVIALQITLPITRRREPLHHTDPLSAVGVHGRF